MVFLGIHIHAHACLPMLPHHAHPLAPAHAHLLHLPMPACAYLLHLPVPTSAHLLCLHVPAHTHLPHLPVSTHAHLLHLHVPINTHPLYLPVPTHTYAPHHFASHMLSLNIAQVLFPTSPNLVALAMSLDNAIGELDSGQIWSWYLVYPISFPFISFSFLTFPFMPPSPSTLQLVLTPYDTEPGNSHKYHRCI